MKTLIVKIIDWLGSINKQRFLFYLFLVILLSVRIVTIAITTNIADGMEKQNLFVSLSIAKGIVPSVFIFQDNIPYSGGGHFIYSLVALPFILFFGKSYFSLRLAGLFLLVLTYILNYKFCYRYFGLKVAIFSSLLFIITTDLLTGFSIIGDGRHFHLNLFFILSLYLFSKIKETKKTLYYLLFGLACGMGVYFYPAFLVTVLVFGLFLILDIDLSKPSFIHRYFLVIICIMIAGNFLFFGQNWYSNFYGLISGSSPKNLIPAKNAASILPRFITIFLWYMPNIFGDFGFLFRQSLKFHFHNLKTLPDVCLEAFRLLLATAFLSLSWGSRKYIKKIIYNTRSISLTKKGSIQLSKYITLFLLAHLFLYVLFFSFNTNAIGERKYYMPLFLNMVLIVAIFLDDLWQRNRYLSFCLLILILFPGIKAQFHIFKRFPPQDFYKHYIWFYNDNGIEFLGNKTISAHKFMCDKLNSNVCYAIGENYGYNVQDLNTLQSYFEYLSGGESNKLKLLYQGFIRQRFYEFKGSDIKSIMELAEKIDKKYWDYCYIGFGENFFILANPEKNKLNLEYEPNLKRNKKMLFESGSLVPDDYKKYFFQGMGEGLARQMAVAYSSYITKDQSYDKSIVNNYLNLINAAYKDDFLTGFFNKDIWSKL